MAEWFPYTTWTAIQQPVLVVCPYCLAVVPKGEAAAIHVKWHIDNDWDPPVPPMTPEQQEELREKREAERLEKKKAEGNGNT